MEKEPIMTEEEVDEIIEYIKKYSREPSEHHYYGSAYEDLMRFGSIETALAQWIRIKNDVVVGNIDKSVIKPYEEKVIEPDDDSEKPF